MSDTVDGTWPKSTGTSPVCEKCAVLRRSGTSRSVLRRHTPLRAVHELTTVVAAVVATIVAIIAAVAAASTAFLPAS